MINISCFFIRLFTRIFILYHTVAWSTFYFLFLEYFSFCSATLHLLFPQNPSNWSCVGRETCYFCLKANFEFENKTWKCPRFWQVLSYLRGGSFFNLHTLLECFVSGYETLPRFLRGGMKHFGPSSSRVWNIFKISWK